MSDLPSTAGPSLNAAQPGSAPRAWLARLGLPQVLALLIIAVTVALFWPAVSQPFMVIDDADYITDHPLVPLGLTWTGLGVAFTARHSGNWHPLATISHMADCQVFGLNPAGHHLVNILLHALNAALLFWVLRRMTGSLWRSFLVAAFFAVHPLRVESVAWISERKDVLCAFFFLLTIWAYHRYVLSLSSQRSTLNYSLSLLFFALALMSKPMAVTLPFVLLLLDFWPLRRFRLSTLQPSSSPALHSPRHSATPSLRLVLEKWPFFLLSLVDCYITSQVQQPAMAELNVLPVSARVFNMILSYGRYLAKLFWPVKLAIVYPYDPSLPVAQVAVALVLFVALSFFAWRFRHRLPWFIMGWLWFLGTLIPVIGLVQVGQQACADRYTYLPSIGILVLVVWTVAFLSGRGALRSLGFLAVAVLLTLSITTRAQLTWWQSSEKLMRHSISVAGPSPMARGGLASELLKQGKLEEAAAQYRLGLEQDGDLLQVVLGLSAVYAAQGKDAEAEHLLRHALAAQPGAAAHFQLADFLQQQGRLDEARIHYLQGLAQAPYHAGARNNLGNVYARQNSWPAAREQFERALKLNPKAAGVHENLGNLLAIQGQMLPAQAEFEAVLKYKTNSAKAHFGLAGVSAAQKQDTNVVRHLREAIRLEPEWLPPLNNLAWLLATDKDPRLRDGPEAVRLASRAVELAKTNDWERLDTLAAAKAEAGQFNDAVAAARQALTLAVQAGQTNEVNGVSNRLELYRQGLPYREP